MSHVESQFACDAAVKRSHPERLFRVDEYFSTRPSPLFSGQRAVSVGDDICCAVVIQVQAIHLPDTVIVCQHQNHFRPGFPAPVPRPAQEVCDYVAYSCCPEAQDVLAIQDYDIHVVSQAA